MNTYSPSIVTGGAEKSINEYATYLCGNGYEVTLVTLHNGKSSEAVWNGRYHEIFVEDKLSGLRDRGPRDSGKYLWHLANISLSPYSRILRKIYLKERPDIVILHNLMGWGNTPWILFKSFGFPETDRSRFSNFF